MADFPVPKSGDLHSAGVPPVTLRAERRVAKFRVLLKDKPSPVNGFSFDMTAHTVQMLLTSKTEPFAEGIDALGGMYYGDPALYELPCCMSTMGDFHSSGTERYQMCQTNSTVFSPFVFADPASELPIGILDIDISGASGGYTYKTDQTFARTLAASKISGIVSKPPTPMTTPRRKSGSMSSRRRTTRETPKMRRRSSTPFRVERLALLKLRSHEKSPYIPFAFLCLLSATSCIEEKLDPCPPQGGSVTVALRVEKFQARPSYRPSDFEQEFGKRIHSLDYLLYAGGQLVGQGRADDLHTASGGDYLFRIDTLPFGTYRLAFVANVTPRMMTGTMDAPEARYIVYQGEKNGDDHFRADVPFEVTCPCRNEFEAVLQRVHGITRFRFENIPARIASVEVVLDNVGQRMPLCGEPDLACEVSKRIPAAQLRTRPAGSFTLGTFCTLPGVRTSWRLRLYGEDDAPLYDRVVTDTLRIECNQLIDLTARFEEGDFRGEIEFSVDVDTTWDGANEGGGEIIR